MLTCLGKRSMTSDTKVSVNRSICGLQSMFYHQYIDLVVLSLKQRNRGTCTIHLHRNDSDAV
jgi:hypothetical protein